MNLKSQKVMASKILKVGLSRVRISGEGLEEVSEAITRDDIRRLIVHKSITTKPKKGNSRGRARKRDAQKKKGRQKGHGLRSGTKKARAPSKTLWINRIRSLRDELSKLKEKGDITTQEYRMMYRQAKGGLFKSRRHLREHIERYLRKK